MVKQFIAEPHKITLSDNTDEAVVTIVADADVVTHDTPSHFIGGLVRVAGLESGDGIFELFSDEGDDNADKWRFRVQDGGVLTLETFQSGAWVTTSQWTIASEQTKPLQPAFWIKPTTSQDNFAVGSDVTVVWGSEDFDQGGDFASNTFTAPVSGRYQLNVSLALEGLDEASTYYALKLVLSNRTIQVFFDPQGWDQDIGYMDLMLSTLADMDASDTAYVVVRQNTGTQQADVSVSSQFSGYLAA